MNIVSAIFAIVAAYFIYSGFALETSVVTEGGTVANLELMHIQATNIALGIGSAIVSAILAVGSAIVTAIRRASQPEVSVPPAQF